MEFDAPEPAPFAPATAASIDPTSDEAHARAVARRHRRLLRRQQQQAAQNPPQVIVAKPPKHRNPAERFVYWWNGWVIRNLHTKVGTVMLGTVGAETQADG